MHNIYLEIYFDIYLKYKSGVFIYYIVACVIQNTGDKLLSISHFLYISLGIKMHVLVGHGGTCLDQKLKVSLSYIANSRQTLTM